MNPLISLSLFLVAVSASASDVTSVTCRFNHLAVDGGAQKIVLTQDPDSGFYAVDIESQRSMMAGGAIATVKTGISAPAYACKFSKKFAGLFKCNEVDASKEAWQGSTLESKIVVDELRGAAYSVFLETKVLTFSASFTIDECVATRAPQL